jgi:Transglycosylase-like domain
MSAVLTARPWREGVLLPVASGRLRAVLAASILAATPSGVVGVAVVNGAQPPNQAEFMWALGQVESGGNYYALNESSGAYGKYQIMPASWRAWADRYLDDPNAAQSPANQETVAWAKVRDLYRGLDRWRRVAYWWLTGSSQRTGWSSYATAYVERVMDRFHARLDRTSRTPRPARHAYSEKSSLITYSGRWKSAEYPRYAGGAVAFSTMKGASASFTFTGSKVIWYGPVGPTRGKARVFIDGRLVRTVDLHASSFDPRRAVFRKRWSSSAEHTLTIVVAGTAGHPYVAIDRLVVVE